MEATRDHHTVTDSSSKYGLATKIGIKEEVQIQIYSPKGCVLVLAQY
jgi:hypothetical protein